MSASWVQGFRIERVKSIPQALVGLGAAVNARDRGGATPLFLACESGHAGAAGALLDAGANPATRNAAGEAPLYIAALRGHGPVVGLLLEHAAATGLAWTVCPCFCPSLCRACSLVKDDCTQCWLCDDLMRLPCYLS